MYKFMEYKIVCTLGIFLENIPWAVLVLQDWRRTIDGTKWTFFCVPSFWISFHSSSTTAFECGVFIALGQRSLLHVLTLRECDVSEILLDSSVPEPRLPDGRLNGRTSGVCTPFSLVPHLRAARTLQALGLLEASVPQSRFPRDEATCTRCHFVKQVR